MLRIKLNDFEGPLDLLVHLVKKEELDIYNIPIAKITDEYLEYIKLMDELDLNYTSEFLLLAAVLLEIKSKLLLPTQEIEKQQEDAEDTTTDLIKQLQEYGQYKEAARYLEEKLNERSNFFSRENTNQKSDDLLPELTLFDLLNAFYQVIKDRPEQKEELRIKKDTISLKEAAKIILNKLRYAKKILFSDLFVQINRREEIIVTFLALLELLRLKRVEAIQIHPFSDIWISRSGGKR
jgi:segregation and condensation protein A